MKPARIENENQGQFWDQLFPLMHKQVVSYHKQRHMGVHSSISVELAQEFITSIQYTIHLIPSAMLQNNLENTLHLGQEILKNKVHKAKKLWTLISQTTPKWQTECRWKAMQSIKKYLKTYDYIHMAHLTPEDFFYPILIAPPEGIQGIDCCLFYLNILWIENQIMYAVGEKNLEKLWDHLPPDEMNQCERVLFNGMGKALIGASLEPLTFSEEEYEQVILRMFLAKEDDLNKAADTLCQWLNIEKEGAKSYVKAVVPLLTMWTGEQGKNCIFENIFL